jgi:ATP-dependent helicase HrpB
LSADPVLPVQEALPRLRAALQQERSAVLAAPPGAGKTTAVPLALLDEPWMTGKRMILLEPRRVAARAAAARMAEVLGEGVGRTVGFRIRGESRVGPLTRIEVVTEGILTRLLQDDPSLEGVGLVLFDEFHERSLHGDLGLALTLEARDLFSPDLRVLVMSATLETGPVASLLGGAPVVEAHGRSHPVEIRYRGRPWPGRVEGVVAPAIRRVLEEEEGDILVFLPGVGEIRRVEAALRGEGLPPGVELLPLHGSLPGEAQDRALRHLRGGGRRVVLSTDIAETSLTLEGVRVVVDAGLARIPRFDPRTGMTRLDTVRVSKTSADQRCGRAGRTAPGVCHRLWTVEEHAALPERGVPGILEADLASLALELAVWGVSDPGTLRWLDLPPAGSFAGARELLAGLGALDDAGAVTAHGRAIAAAGVHPRLAHLLLWARGEGNEVLQLASEVAAILEERDFVTGESSRDDPDLSLRVALVRGAPPGGVPVDRRGLERVRQESRRLMARMGGTSAGARGAIGELDGEEVGRLLALAYPDRVAMARPGGRGRFLLAGGRGAFVPPGHPLAVAPFLVAARLLGQGAEDRILLAAPLNEEDLRSTFRERIRPEDRVEWDSASGGVLARREERFGALVLRAAPLPDPDPALLARALLEGIRATGPEALPWSEDAWRLVRRVAFVSAVEPGGWPDLSPPSLMASLEGWLLPWMTGFRRLGDLRGLDLERVLEGLLPPGWRPRLDRLAPPTLQVPSGSSVAVDYSDADSPVLAVRLQELFGLSETPRVGGGRVPVTLHLLSPARRPVQVTRDLASFWRSAYPEVRRELRARYPKHSWPEDPLRAEPVRGVPRKR